MTLWGFLTVLTGVAAFGAALSASCDPPAPTSWIGVAVGLCVSVVCVVLLRLMGDHLGRRIAKNPQENQREAGYRNLYIAAFAWIVASSVIAFCIGKWVMHAVGR